MIDFEVWRKPPEAKLGGSIFSQTKNSQVSMVWYGSIRNKLEKK